MTYFLEKPDFIYVNGASFPRHFFYIKEVTSAKASPAATFKATEAIKEGGQAFQTNTAPSAVPEQKSLIITNSILAVFLLPECLAIVHFLKNKGFSLSLCLESQYHNAHIILPIDDDLDEFPSNLATFDEKDYETLAEIYGKCRDKTLVLDDENIKSLTACLRQTMPNEEELKDGIQTTAWRKSYRHFSREKLFEKRLTELNLHSNFSSFLDSFPEKAIETLDHFSKNHGQRRSQWSFLTHLNTIMEPLFVTSVNLFEEKNRLVRAIYEKLFLDHDEFIKISEKYNNKNSIREFFYNYIPELIEKNFPIHLHTQDKYDLEFFSKFYPEKCKAWLFENPNSKYLSTTVLINLIRAYPDEINVFLEKFSHIHHSRDSVSTLIYHFPEYKFDLFEKFQHLFSIFNLPRSFPPQFFMEKFQNDICSRDTVSSAISHCKGNSDLILELLQKYKHYLDGRMLINAIEGCSAEHATLLLEKYALQVNHDLENELVDLFWACPDSLFMTLLERYRIDDIRESQLFTIVSTCPRQYAAMMFEKYAPLLMIYDRERSIRDIFSILNLPLRKKALEQYGHNFTISNFVTIFRKTDSFQAHIDILYEGCEKHALSLKDFSFIDHPKGPYSYSNPFLDQTEITYLYAYKASDLLRHDVPANHLIVIEIATFEKNISPESILKHIKENCPKLKELILPDTVEAQVSAITHNIPFRVTFESFRFDPDLIEYNNKMKNKSGWHIYEPIRFTSSHRSPTGFYASVNQSSTRMSDNTDIQTYHMAQVGECLNPSTSMTFQVRTGVIKTKDDFTMAIRNPKKFRRVEKYGPLTQNKINEYRRPNQDYQYCQFTHYLPANTRTRLFSVDPHETFEAANYTQVSIEKGDDDIYYATSRDAIHFTYILKASSEKNRKQAYLNIPDNHPIKDIINDYFNSMKYQRITPPNQAIPKRKGNYKKWCEELYEERAGVCAHRCYAVENRIKQHSNSSEHVRIIEINQNHTVLEIKVNQHWHKIDLGGGVANVFFDKKPTRQPYQSYQPPQNQSGQLSEDNSVKNIVEEHIRPRMHYKPDDLLACILEAKEKKILLTSEQLESDANRLLDAATKQGRIVYYIDSPEKIDICVEQIRLNKAAHGENTYIGLLEDFLKNAAQTPSLLLINWTRFDAQQRLALNDMLSNPQMIRGQDIPAQCQVVSLCKQRPEDDSFINRHEKFVESKLPPYLTQKNNKKEPSSMSIIDLKGLPRWRDALFGPIQQKGKQLVWEKSDWVKSVENDAEQRYEIINLSDKAAEQIRYEVEQAKAVGYIDYYGYRIPVSKNLEVRCQENVFDFMKFNPITVYRDMTAEYIDTNTPLINTYLFDYLLVQKQIVNGEYFEAPGLIEKNANGDFTIFITSPLSNNQWYCLFEKSQTHHVRLILNLAQDVFLPEKIKINNDNPVTEKQKSQNIPRIYLSNNTTATAQRIAPNVTTIDIEDYCYPDLFEGVDFMKTEHGFSDFQSTISDMLAALKKGEKVVLKGEFSEEMLRFIEPMILQYHDRLIIIVEELFLKEIPSMLSWLSSESIEKCYEDVFIKEQNVIFNEPSIHFQAPIDLSNAHDDALEFLKKRQDCVSKNFESHNVLQLVGESEVGKSYLILTLPMEKYRIYNEWKNIHAWAGDKTKGKKKVLFIDEFNIDDKHLTCLSAILNVGEKSFFHEGRRYTLDDDHVLVLASNQKHYGGGRVDQKFIDDHFIPEMHLNTLPPSYIYEFILKPISDLMSVEDHVKFQNFCKTLLEEFYQSPVNERLSLHGLEEKVLGYCLFQKHNMGHNKEYFYTLPKDDYICTPHTSSLRDKLTKFIRARKILRKPRYATLNGFGTNGFLLEGPSGCGKSNTIQYMLEKLGYRKAKLNFNQLYNPCETDEPLYYKLDASWPTFKKKQALRKIFHEGNAVWIDEINTCLGDGLEKYLNALSTGFDPETKKPAKKSGFMPLMTANSISGEGRHYIGPAFRARCEQHTLNPPNAIDYETILRMHLPDEVLKNTDIRSLAESLKMNPNINLRLLTKDLIEKLCENTLRSIQRINHQTHP